MDSGIKPGWWVALGVIWGATVGALLLLLSRSKPLGDARLQPINIWNVSGGTLGALPMPSSSNEAPLPVQTEAPVNPMPMRMSTYVLRTTDAVRIMTAASGRYWRVQLRTIGPPGGVAFISTDINGASYPSQSFSLPAGDPAEIKVRPGDSLFALGNIPNVELSIAAAEDLTT